MIITTKAEFEYQRNCGGCWHAQCIEDVQQYYVYAHYSHEYAYQIIEGEEFRTENAMPGDIHHAV